MDASQQTVLVTGAAGFIGSHLVAHLVHCGHRVRAFVRYNARQEVGHLAALGPDVRQQVEVFAGDLTDPTSVLRAMAGCQRVLHLGALIGIPYSYHAPAHYVATNVQGTLHVLEAARQVMPQRVVHVSTSEVYGTAQYSPMDEAHPLQAQSPYAATKIAADKLAESYARSFDLPVVTLRPFNTFGPRQSSRAVIPALLGQALWAPRIRVGDLSPVRDFVYVADTVTGMTAAAFTPDLSPGEVIHLGTGHGHRIQAVLQWVLAATGRKEEDVVRETQRMRPPQSEVWRLVADARKAQTRLGWHPQVAFEDGLNRLLTYLQQVGPDAMATTYVI
jgi:NAD dependent epimerase/dehydratase